MIKDIGHMRSRHASACKRVIMAIDSNPNAFKGLKIPPKAVIVNDNLNIRNISIAGLLLAIFVRVFH